MGTLATPTACEGQPFGLYVGPKVASVAKQIAQRAKPARTLKRMPWARRSTGEVTPVVRTVGSLPYAVSPWRQELIATVSLPTMGETADVKRPVTNYDSTCARPRVRRPSAMRKSAPLLWHPVFNGAACALAHARQLHDILRVHAPTL